MTKSIKNSDKWKSLDFQNTRVKNMIGVYRKKADVIRKDARLSPKAKEDDLAKLRADIADSILKESREDADKLIAALRDEINTESKRKPKTDIQEDIRNELQQMRVLNNLRPLFERAFENEHGLDPLSLVQQLAKQANETQDHALLSVLQNDVPFLFRGSRLADGTDALEEQMRTLIESETADMAPDWVKQANEDLKTLEQAESFFNLNMHEVQKSLDESNLTGDVVFSELTGETTTLVGEKGSMTATTGRTAYSGNVTLNSWQPGYGDQGTQVTVSDSPPE